MNRATKIIATCGPATDKPAVIEQLLQAGVNVFRLNFSHGSATQHSDRAQHIRAVAKQQHLHVGILCDLQGPKIRVARFKQGSIQLAEGATFCIDSQYDYENGNEKIVGCDFKTLHTDCAVGDMLLLDDGKIQLKIVAIDGTKLATLVKVAGKLSNNKGLNKKGGGLNAAAITTKDRRDILSIKAINPEFLALSFVRNEDDIFELRKLVKEAGFATRIVAKIERSEAIANKAALDATILASDVIMVARGDLGVEIGDARLIGMQKYLIRRTIALNRTVITATQMMESMIENNIPTRAEVFDVANAILDGTDAVMLSAETAAGNHPVLAVQAMSKICIGAEGEVQPEVAIHKISDKYFDKVNEAIAYACLHTALQVKNIKLMACFTESGSTPFSVSRVRGNVPILALSRDDKILSTMALWRGVMPQYFDITQYKPAKIPGEIVRVGRYHLPNLTAGDRIIITRGDKAGISGTNRMHLYEIKAGD